MFAHVAPLLADAFGYAFWLVVVLTAVALVPAAVLVFRRADRDPAQASASGASGASEPTLMG
jgi:hypothetical protein